MPTLSATHWPRTVRVAATLFSVLAVCGILYWAQVVLIPVALAALLAFLFTPLVVRLERWGIPRIPAVITVVLTAGLIFTGVGWLIAEQVSGLASDLPGYRENITEKLTSVRRLLRDGAIERVQDTIDDVQQEMADEAKAAGAEANQDGEQPIPVVITASDGFFPRLAGVAPLARTLGTAGLVVVLNIFMLIQREGMLDRGVSLVGSKSISATTKALHEAGNRISRYLLMQFAINVGFGIAVAVGLALIGVPYSLLWGACAALFRYVPYIGPWFAAALPATVALIHFSTWTPLVLVLALFIALELVTNNVLEPWLYGRSVGISSVAVILAAVFWAWMWGPLGLVMATPITVCLVVLGKYIPSLSIFDRLLSDRPALKPHVWLFQRLLSRDAEDAEEIVEEFLEEHSPDETCEELLMPLLALAHREHANGRITPDDEQFLVATVRALVDDLILPPADEDSREGAAVDADAKPLVIGLSTTPSGRAALEMLARLLTRHCRVQILQPEMMISDWMAAIGEAQPACVCLSSLPPGKLTRARLVCKRLRQQFPDLKIVVGRWGVQASATKSRQTFEAAGANQMAVSLSEMRQIVIPIVQFHATRGKQPAAAAVES